MTERNKGGRPKSSDREQKLQIRVSTAELERMQAAADAAHIPLATWARARLLDAARQYTTKRYAVRTIANLDSADLDALGETLYETDDRAAAKARAIESSHSHTYGTVVVDHVARTIDWGHKTTAIRASAAHRLADR